MFGPELVKRILKKMLNNYQSFESVKTGLTHLFLDRPLADGYDCFILPTRPAEV